MHQFPFPCYLRKEAIRFYGFMGVGAVASTVCLTLHCAQVTCISASVRPHHLRVIALTITQPSIYGVIVYFLLCHESRSINMTIDWHYTMGLVSCFPVKNTQALIIMRDDAARTVRL